jgi:uncharacterized protein YcgI (DUF1989 family)
MTGIVKIPARRGKAAFVNHGQHVRVINTHGQQVVDTWAFNRSDLSEWMSMEHSRAGIGRILPQVGDRLCTNRRRPILTIVHDDSGGRHDTLIAACDVYRYQLLGCAGHHDNCTENLAASLRELGISVSHTPSPWNLFMNIPVAADGTVSFLPPVSTPGSSITVRAEMDLVIAFSACPQDIIPINGTDCRPTDAHFEVR